MSETIYRPKTRNIIVQPLDEQEVDTFIVCDDEQSHFVLVKSHGVYLLNAMDGKNTPEEIQAHIYASHHIKLSQEQIRSFLDMAARNNLVQDGTWLVTSAGKSRSMPKRILIRAEPLSDWIGQHRGAVVNPITVTIIAIGVFFGIQIFLMPYLFGGGGMVVQPSLEAMFPLLLLSLVQIILHELGHLVACSYFGVQSKGFGYGLIWRFLPIIFTDTSRAYLLPNRFQRALISLAGPLADFTILGFVALLLLVLPQTSVTHNALSQYAPMLKAIILLNLNPLLVNFDGYWILVDLLRKPNLYRNSRAFIRVKLSGLIGRGSKRDTLIVQAQLKQDKRAGLIYIGYFLASTIASAIFLVLMAMSAAQLFRLG